MKCHYLVTRSLNPTRQGANPKDNATETSSERIRANLTDTRAILDHLTELLVNLGDLYDKCEPAERRILNRALFTRITIDDDEHATYTPDEPAASILAHLDADVPTNITGETNLPRDHAGQVSNFSTYVDLRREFDNLGLLHE